MDIELRDTIEKEVHSAVQNTQNQLLNSLTSLLDARLDGLKHNQEVFVKMREARNQIETDNVSQENITEARKKIVEGMDLIKNRQKLIKLADSSEAGRRVVDGYVSNPLAEDSDDEKKIYKAQTRAESKLKKEKTKRRTDQRLTPYEHKKSAPTGNPVSVSNSIRPGRCFNCNEKGHWRREYPQQTVDHGKKISICIFRSTRIESSTPKSIIQMSNSNTHTTIDSKLTQAHKNSTGVGRSGKVNRWKEICTNSYIVDVIDNGYYIPF